MGHGILSPCILPENILYALNTHKHTNRKIHTKMGQKRTSRTQVLLMSRD